MPSIFEKEQNAGVDGGGYSIKRKDQSGNGGQGGCTSSSVGHCEMAAFSLRVMGAIESLSRGLITALYSITSLWLLC